MRVRLLLAALCMVATVQLQPGLCTAGASRKLAEGGSVPKISNGQRAPAGMFPWSVALFTKNPDPNVRKPQFIVMCGGSLIKDNVVLTAAHCVDGLPRQKSYVKAGLINIDDDLPKIRIKKAYMHPKYDSWSGTFDVALLHLDASVGADAPVVPLALPHMKLKRGDPLTIMGFGNTPTNDMGSKNLLYASVSFVPFMDCQSFYWQIESEIPNTAMCTATLGRESICPGDSGSPLVTKDGVQVGINAFAPYGSVCGGAGHWMGHTDLRKVHKFIESTLAKIAAKS